MSEESEFNFQDHEELPIQRDYEQIDEEQMPYNQPRHNQTELPKIDCFTTKERYLTLMHTEPDTKNVPKTLGNNFKKFMEKMKTNKKGLSEQLPKEMNEFLHKKQTGKQSNYIINDFKDLFKNENCRQWFIYYIKNCAFLDLVHSNRIENAEEQIHFIEQYLAGALQPENFICNRNSNGKKTDLKKIKAQQKQAQQQQQVFELNGQVNTYSDYDNEEQSQQHIIQDYIQQDESNQLKIEPLIRKNSFEKEEHYEDDGQFE